MENVKEMILESVSTVLPGRKKRCCIKRQCNSHESNTNSKVVPDKISPVSDARRTDKHQHLLRARSFTCSMQETLRLMRMHSVSKLTFLSVMDVHTYIPTQNEMRSRISCLALRRSATRGGMGWGKQRTGRCWRYGKDG